MGYYYTTMTCLTTSSKSPVVLSTFYAHSINTIGVLEQVPMWRQKSIIQTRYFLGMTTVTTQNKQLWDNVLEHVQGNISGANFSTWFKDTFIARQEAGTIYISVPNQFVRDWVKNKYHSLILRTLRSLSSDVRGVEYIISKQRPGEALEHQQQAEPAFVPGELPLQNLYISKEDNLNPRYTFDSFVVGAFNELAFAAAQAIIKNLGQTYNPYLVYGRTGHGKTHLIQAIGNEVKKQAPDTKIFYTTSEKFAQDLVNALRSNKITGFKEKYRKYDMLIMDDVQFLSGKEKTQEELFHLFNTLYDNNKQIIFSSDQHPHYIQNLEERLQSRFGAGMIVDISAPDKESRVAIVKAKAQSNNFMIEDSVAEYVASSIEGNVRELEGALNTIICQSQLKKKDLSLAEVKAALKNNVKPRRVIPVEDVVRLVADYYNIDTESIYKKTRKKEVVRPRQLIMYLLREDFSMPYPAIGQKIGRRDHTTVIHSYEKVKKDLENNNTLAQEIEQIRSMI